ncbi:hypothetical protein MACH09_45760 [Vibrio sp. MACH09]|uniref:DUF3487 family protein n=1 Tax=Vibrio sp. MACH09 TaxID=3025122 RepID=UPI002793354C|nr:DUF3487 family protein [Vibrio sp. MACH09]GLO64068.1 hypothetical protein MACH09_45760 [Vibrio sp. MACH09]
MKNAATLNVMPPFYKGLSMGELGVLTTINTVLMSIVGIGLFMFTGYWLAFVSSLMIGLISVLLLPKALIRVLTRTKSAHCQHYFQKHFDRWYRNANYHISSRRFATRRSNV